MYLSYIFLLITFIKSNPTPTSTPLSWSNTDVLSETYMFSVYPSQSPTISDGTLSYVESQFLTYVITNMLIQVYISGEIPSATSIHSISPTLNLPFYFQPPILIGGTFGLVFLFGFLYTSCCTQTELIKNPKYKNAIVEIHSDLSDISDKHKKKSKKSKSPKSSKKSKKSSKYV